MLAFARLVQSLQQSPAYIQAIQQALPPVAAVEPGHPSMLMGYDFHLTDEGPKLIEINNNAGGLFAGFLPGAPVWLPQPKLAAMHASMESRILAMFPQAWRHIAIVDESIEQQYLYPEMQAYGRLLERDGRSVHLLSPEDMRLTADGLYHDEWKVDAIYNRHTDFYLESSALQHIRQAYETGLVELNPYPRSYALLGDKSRMVDWWRPGLMEPVLTEENLALLRRVVPETHLLREYDREQAWTERNRWVFKPVARHGGKGVLMGKSISRTRFNALESDTAMQQLVPASLVECHGEPYKLDLRLFMYGEQLIAIGGRVWKGQVTNFREAGSGWVPLEIAAA